jgi:cob(I)alamin adenosyltransferase
VRQHPGMRSDLHLDPDRLRDAAAVAAGLVDELRAATAGSPATGPAADRMRAALRRAVEELAELGFELAATAEAAQRDDAMAARSLRRLRPHA